jgi:CrcB protein
VGTGFLGAYTTFASYSYDTFGLLEGRAPAKVVLNAVGSVVAGLAAATVGFALAGVC